MSEVEATPAVGRGEHAGAGWGARYTRKNPYFSTVVGELPSDRAGFGEGDAAPGIFAGSGDDVRARRRDRGDPENRAQAVAEVLGALGFAGEERVLDHYKVELSFEEALRSRLTIGKLARGTIGQYAKLRGSDGCWRAWIRRAEADMRAGEQSARGGLLLGREFIDLITDFPGAVRAPQELFNVLPRLVPRLYSIASSQAVHPGIAETSVRVVRYDTHGRDRQGVASGQLGERAHVGEVLPIFLAANQNFKLPEDSSAPVIMVGPGTGVAPFRAFLEERQAKGASGDNWLFFGDQHRADDFLYEEQWSAMLKDGTLTRLDTAFSRDQAEKIYVQDRMRENAAELYAWLERGAYFYVCGDATRMAKAVELALLDAIAEGSQGTLDAASAYLNAMKQQKRYQRDVY